MGLKCGSLTITNPCSSLIDSIEIQDLPNAYYGLALLYRMAGEMEAGRDVLETFFARSNSMQGIESSPIYQEARKLYKEISGELGLKDRGH